MSQASRSDRRRHAIRALLGDRRSIAALEFAFAAPVLLTIVFGLINVGDLAWTYNALDAAVSASARYASVTEANALLAAGSGSAPSACVATSDIQGQFAARATPPIPSSAVPSVKILWGGALGACGGTLTAQSGWSSLPGGWVGVSAQYRWTPIAPLGFGINLSATSVLPVMTGIQA